MRKPLWLLWVLMAAASGCVTIQNTEICSVAGILSAGGICAETLTGKTRDLTFDQTLDMLEAQPSPRPDPANPGQVLPPHGAAIIQTLDDYSKDHTELEQACRELGSRCSYATQQAIQKRQQVLKRFQAGFSHAP